MGVDKFILIPGTSTIRCCWCCEEVQYGTPSNVRGFDWNFQPSI